MIREECQDLPDRMADACMNVLYTKFLKDSEEGRKYIKKNKTTWSRDTLLLLGLTAESAYRMLAGLQKCDWKARRRTVQAFGQVRIAWLIGSFTSLIILYDYSKSTSF